MERKRKHGEVIERYAGDLLIECFAVYNEILDRAEDEDREVTVQESRELRLLNKIALLLCDFTDLEERINRN